MSKLVMSARLSQRRFVSLRAVLVGVVASAALTACSSDASPVSVSDVPYSSEALESAKAMVGLQVAAVRSDGHHLTYRETRDSATALGLTVIAGGSRDPKTVSVQVEFVSPAGVVPVAVEDGRDCVMAVIVYPVGPDERFPSPGAAPEGPLFPVDGSQDGIKVSWILFHDYFLQPDVLPSAVCAAEAFAGVDLTSFEPSFDPAFPTVFDPPT